MKKVAIVTDSTSCLPPELVDRYGITIVPLVVVYEGKDYRDGVDMSPNEVYKLSLIHI